MRKFFPILLLFVCFLANAQDSVAVMPYDELVADSLAQPSKPVKSKFSEKDIQVDSAKMQTVRFAEDLKRKYDDSDFVYEQKTAGKNFWDRFLEWLGSIIKNIFNIGTTKASVDIVVIILKTLAVLVLIFVVYLIVKAILNKEGKWIFGRNSAKKIIRYDDIEKNLQATDFEKLIADSLRQGEKRLCVRYYYLWLLKKLSERGYIEWDLEKTNSDYLYEIQNPARRGAFAYCSYLYNYIWYGEFDIDDETFEKARKAFEKTIQSI